MPEPTQPKKIVNPKNDSNSKRQKLDNNEIKSNIVSNPKQGVPKQVDSTKPKQDAPITKPDVSHKDLAGRIIYFISLQ